MSSHHVAHALRRFGLGGRPGDARRVAADPMAYVAAQLDRSGGGLPTGEGLVPSHDTLGRLVEMRQRLREARRAAPQRSAATPATPSAPNRAQTTVDRPGVLIRQVVRAEADARVRHAITTETALVERLVMYWSNHFAVASRKGNVRAIAGAYEREAIRPYVLGRFADMLMAVVKHPAMLIYLDNQVSIGPASRAGSRRGRGLNENLARELLELHTLGVDGGYGQADVTSLARLLTGWTFGGPGQQQVEVGRFWFVANRHEPGPHRVLARSYATGMKGGEQALTDLARHPATARHVATRLAAHFVASPPPPALVKTLSRAFRDSDGDLAVVSRALVGAPDAWRMPPGKMLPPYDYLVSLARAFAPDTPPRRILRLASALGQPLWDPPSPKGWPDDDDAWIAPAALTERLRIAEQLAVRVATFEDPRVSARDIVGDGLRKETAEAIARAESARQGFEILMLSPDLQRR